MIELKNIYKNFNIGDVSESKVFENFDFKVDKGQFVSIVGSNGSGKTTLLNLVCGSIMPDSGRIFIENQDITNLREYKRYENIGRVYQNPSLGSCPDMTILENMSIAENKGKKFDLTMAVKMKNIDYFKDLLSSINLGLEDKLNVKIGSLSGGQRQAISLLMATMTPIKILVLDEHTAALDPKTADTIMEITNRIVKEKNLTALMVTHNLRYAVEFGNRMVMLHGGEVVLDKKDEEKKKTSVNDVLAIFNTISIECGN